MTNTTRWLLDGSASLHGMHGSVDDTNRSYHEGFEAGEKKAAAEIERLRKALYQVLTDCEVAGNLSYAARTAHEALGE